jgi:hypothetical protein
MKWIDCPTHRPGGIRRRLVRLVLGLMLGPGAVAAAEETTIALPPFLVEEAAQPLPWRYAEVGGCEVLSTCPDRLTRELVANHLRLHALLGELVPPALQWRTSERPLLIFVDSAHQPPTSPEVVAQLVLSAVEPPVADDAPAADDGRLRRRPKPPRYTFLPNLRLWDRDGQALFAIVREREFDPGRVALSPEYVTYVLRHRIPALPPWFVSGVLTLFSTARFGDDALTLERLDWPAESGVALLRGGAGANRGPPCRWRSFSPATCRPGDPAGGGTAGALAGPGGAVRAVGRRRPRCAPPGGVGEVRRAGGGRARHRGAGARVSGAGFRGRRKGPRRLPAGGHERSPGAAAGAAAAPRVFAAPPPARRRSRGSRATGSGSRSAT